MLRETLARRMLGYHNELHDSHVGHPQAAILLAPTIHTNVLDIVKYGRQSELKMCLINSGGIIWFTFAFKDVINFFVRPSCLLSGTQYFARSLLHVTPVCIFIIVR